MAELSQSIQIIPPAQLKVVSKPWGSETWLAYGEGMPYALKVIRLKAGTKTSLQYHQHKRETNFVYAGRIRFHFQKDPDGPVEQVELEAGTCIQVPPGRIHRVEALEDVILVESSTNHLDDVVRLSDDYKRPDGRISSEHGAPAPAGEKK
ncbi:Mannose-6-phosphate isomerase [uncultured archaeon]|nr:Mannose-6-phosphate isomerase [uncultured archaeon]